MSVADSFSSLFTVKISKRRCTQLFAVVVQNDTRVCLYSRYILPDRLIHSDSLRKIRTEVVLIS